MGTDPSGMTRRGAIGAIAAATVGGGATSDTQRPSAGSAVVEPQSLGRVSVTDFGAAADGRSDDTAAFRRAIDHLEHIGGGTLLLPPGQYLTGTISFPYDPTVINVVGSGRRSSVWRMADPAQPIIAIDRSSPPQRVTGASFTDFSVAAHPDGRAGNLDHVAIDAQGFNDALFRNIRFLSDGEGSVGAMFFTSSARHLTYNQRFERLAVERCVGPGKVIATGGGDRHFGNANLIFIDGFWIYANRGMEAAFDMNHCTTYAIRNGLIEASADYGILLGNAGIIESVWFEEQARAPVRFASLGEGAASSNNLLRNLYFGGFGGTIDIPRDCLNNTFQNVTGGNFRITIADPLGGNVLTSSTGIGDKPGLRQFAGSPARLREVQALCVSRFDGHWQILYQLEIPGPGNFGFRFIAPDGRRITKLFVTALDAGSGTVVPCALGWPVQEFFVSATNGNPISIVAQISYI